jgi:hypothetical protein
MRNQYKVLAEKYDIINDARKLKAPAQAKIGPYEADYFNFLEYTKNYPDQKEFMDWLYSELEGRGETGDEMFGDQPLPVWEKLCSMYDSRVEGAGYGARHNEDDLIDRRSSAVLDSIAEQKNNIDKDYKTFLAKKLLKKASGKAGIEMDI